jgi:hypothetical protein
MLRTITFVAFLVSGCAVDQPSPIVRTRIVKERVMDSAQPTPRASCKPLKETCGLMASCAEAAHYFSKCQAIKLDRNMNGVPCENLYGQKPGEMCDRIRRAPMFMSEGQMSIGSIPAACVAQ